MGRSNCHIHGILPIALAAPSVVMRVRSGHKIARNDMFELPIWIYDNWVVCFIDREFMIQNELKVFAGSKLCLLFDEDQVFEIFEKLDGCCSGCLFQ